MSLDSAEEFGLHQAVRGALAMVGGLAEKYHIRLIVDLPDEEVRLIAVERMVRQILINLVGNAIKFTPEGGSVTVGGGPAPEGGYMLTVRDTGIGMSEKEIVQALLPFGQNDTKMSKRHDGTGLGLPLAKAMLELHGGSLVVASRPNHGTIITLHFPAERLAAAEVAAA
jgi:signal transduction histidine kinase